MKKKNRPRGTLLPVLPLLLLLVAMGAVLFSRGRVMTADTPPSPPVETPAPAAPGPAQAAAPASETPVPRPREDPEAGSIRINEYMTKNSATLCGDDGVFCDWVELKNVSDHSVSLLDWRLSEGGKDFSLPERTLGAGELLLIFASGTERKDTLLSAPFSLSEGETLCLYTPLGVLSDETACLASEEDVAFTRGEDGTFTESLYPTPGEENSRAGYAAWQSGLTVPGPLVISEAAVKNFDFDFDGGEDCPDWVEIKNISDSAVDLGGYYLSDSKKDYLKCPLPAMRLEPGELCLILCTEEPDNYAGRVCLPLSLDAEREHLFLSDGETLCDYLPLRDIPCGGSCGRMDGENGSFYFAAPTPGEANADGRRYLCARPEPVTADGVFEGVESVTCELRGEGDIYYTLDGSLPTADSSRYSGPITIESTCALRAVCMDGQGYPSRPASFSFILNEGHSLPVLSVMADDPAALEDLYKRGVKGEELSGSISFFEPEGSFRIDCGIRMAGRASLYYPKKNITFKFRGAYGQSRLNYDIFGGGLTEFDALTIRAGTDSEKAVIRNELSQELASEFSDRYVNQRSRYCVVYVNGDYFGVYALKEKINRQFCADFAGVAKESVTMYNGPAVEGEDFWNEVVYPILYEDIGSPEVYDRVCRSLDMESYIDWLIIEGYCGNRDILYGNLSYFRSPDYHDNRWVPIFYDLDATFRDGRYNFRNLHNLNYSLNQNSQMLRHLLTNDSFRQAYLNRAAEALGETLTNEHVEEVIASLYAQIDGEMERSCLRWGFSYRNYLDARDKLLRLIPEFDYESNSVDVISEMASLTEEERQYYFGR